MRKTCIHIIEIILGIVFIISALFKMNDPLGLAYKMQEVIELLHIQISVTYLFLLSVIFNTIELLLGFNMLFGWYRFFTKWAYAIFLLFFLLFTGYATETGAIKECGCMGNCFPLQAKMSFIKDIVLIGLLGILFFIEYKNPQKLPILKALKYVVLVSLFGIFIQLFSYLFLPYVDCMSFKKGTNITTALGSYHLAQKDSLAIEFIYNKQGKEIHFSADNFPEDFDSTYVFISREDKIIPTQKNVVDGGISEFSLSDLNNRNVTDTILNMDTVYLFFVMNYLGWRSLPLQEIDSLRKIGSFPFYIVGSNASTVVGYLKEYHIPLNHGLVMDDITLITIARSPFTFMVLEKGTIKKKQGMLTTGFSLINQYDQNYRRKQKQILYKAFQ
ncbi:MAG: MauE/DoxX family redox-associated membrane protein [Chitinophagaceae bacterium]